VLKIPPATNTGLAQFFQRTSRHETAPSPKTLCLSLQNQNTDKNMNNNEVKNHLIFFKQNIVNLRDQDLYPKIDEYFDRTVFINNIDFLERNSLIIEDDNRDSIYSITDKGERFLKQIIEEDKYIAEKEKIEFENLKYSTEVNKWLLKTKWYPLIISIIAVLVSIVLGFKDDSKIDELEERISNLEKKSESIKNDAKPLKIYPKVAVEKVANKKSDTLK
jgi:DNA-binding PadR family transcriptional regulator